MQRVKRIARRFTFAALFAGMFYAVAGYVLLPPLVKWAAGKYVADKTGHALTLGAVRFHPFALSLSLRDLKLSRPDGEVLGGFDELFVDFELASALQRAYVFDSVRLSGPRLALALRPEGQLNWSDFIAALQGEEKKEEAGATHFLVRRIDVERGELNLADLRDKAAQPALHLRAIHAETTNLSHDLDQVLPLRLGFKLESGGDFEASGTVIPGKPAADMQIKLAGLSLKPAQPYLARALNLAIESGSVSTTGRLAFDGEPDYAGDFALDNLLLRETPSGEHFMSLKRLSTQELRVGAKRLTVGATRVDGLVAKLIINPDKTTNLKDVAKKDSAARPSATQPAKSSPAAEKFQLGIGSVEVVNSELDFADLSLALPFGARIHGLKGRLDGIDRQTGAPTVLALEGRVDDYGMARVSGRIKLFDPAEYMDVRALFRNVEMTRLTPYLATFAGRKIESGKLTVDLEYKIKDRQLAGNNQVVMDRLTLGERVESPTAKDLPLDLALAILSDTEGRIDLDLPVSGSLDAPQFSFSQIVWKAISNVVAKVVTAPFRALGKLFGTDGERIERLAFDPGSATLLPPEREVLKNLAQGMAKRPNLILAVRGMWDPVSDRASLKELRLRVAIAKAMGIKLSEEEEAPPVSTANPKAQNVIETLYEGRIGKAELKSLKARYYQANPTKQPTMGKMLSTLSGLLKPEAPLAAGELEKLKGADLHALMYEQLLAKEPVSDEMLMALANKRAQAVANELIAANGVAKTRVEIGTPQPTEDKDKRVRIGLSLGVAGKSAP